jgi:hypothetical protein
VPAFGPAVLAAERELALADVSPLPATTPFPAPARPAPPPRPTSAAPDRPEAPGISIPLEAPTAAARYEAPATSGTPAEFVPSATLRALRGRVGRSVPLTRLPLRSRARTVTWPSLLLDAGNAAAAARAKTDDARLNVLAELAGGEAAAPESVFIAAYREEDEPGRLLALRALAHFRSARVRAICEEALRVGQAAERAAAVDALTAAGARESLSVALRDPVDAIAARAALAFVATREPADYRLALEPYVDPVRIDALLALLAGYLR